ncbi:MAG TPA: Stp1/IreP family PP2C-type Ser/Thr phosphatase [Blastocatellia bacterium]|jgi:serine/threonine protein phosphatase PrpC|nr:Stp1/IreP family PP2C-type Ser/Thr phosphatase [Blastocatellia bacterium]
MKTTKEKFEISISAAGLTDIGITRVANEDALLLADLSAGGQNVDVATMTLGEQGALLAVADGMGGSASGEIASALAIAAVREALMNDNGDRASSEQLRRAVELANARVWEYAQRNPEMDGMGATLTAALARDGIAYLAQVGDSRAYLIRGQSIEQITKDQSLTQKMLDSGLLSPEEAARHPYRTVILQALGVKPEINVTLTALTLCRDDCLLLCSDGLSNAVTPAEMRRVVDEAESPAYACHWLIELANARGGDDNITVIVAHFAGAGLYESDARATTGSFNLLPKAA